MLLEARVELAVLCFGAEPDAVGEDGFELVVVSAPDIRAIVDDESGEVLADALAHDAGLAMVDMKAFILEDGGDVGGEALSFSGEGCVS